MANREETKLMKHIMLELPSLGYQVFRTNVGTVRMPDGRYFSTGLPKGHPDLYGFDRNGHIFYVECKYKDARYKSDAGKPTIEQVRFIRAMRKVGAYAGIAYCIDDAITIAKGEGQEIYEDIMKEVEANGENS